MPCHTISYHIIPYHTIPYPITSIPYHTISYHTIPYHVISSITSHNIFPLSSCSDHRSLPGNNHARFLVFHLINFHYHHQFPSLSSIFHQYYQFSSWPSIKIRKALLQACRARTIAPCRENNHARFSVFFPFDRFHYHALFSVIIRHFLIEKHCL